MAPSLIVGVSPSYRPSLVVILASRSRKLITTKTKQVQLLQQSLDMATQHKNQQNLLFMDVVSGLAAFCFSFTIAVALQALLILLRFLSGQSLDSFPASLIVSLLDGGTLGFLYISLVEARKVSWLVYHVRGYDLYKSQTESEINALNREIADKSQPKLSKNSDL